LSSAGALETENEGVRHMICVPCNAAGAITDDLKKNALGLAVT
jgi:hypothetical protein